MTLVYLGLGTNVGERRGNLRRAVALLRKAGRPGGRPYERQNPDRSPGVRTQYAGTIRVRRVSPVYETEPQIVTDQPWFLNQVVEVETGLAAARLHAVCRKIERMMGRRRGRRFGPRVMDIDILLYGNRIVGDHARSPLRVPHPRMQERRFVLKPLADLAPSLVPPVLGKTIRALLRRCPARGQTVRRRMANVKL